VRSQRTSGRSVGAGAARGTALPLSHHSASAISAPASPASHPASRSARRRSRGDFVSSRRVRYSATGHVVMANSGAASPKNAKRLAPLHVVVDRAFLRRSVSGERLDHHAESHTARVGSDCGRSSGRPRRKSSTAISGVQSRHVARRTVELHNRVFFAIVSYFSSLCSCAATCAQWRCRCVWSLRSPAILTRLQRRSRPPNCILGRYAADSAGEGRGPTFTVTLPVSTMPEAMPSRHRPEAVRSTSARRPQGHTSFG
jgi:hypothetical protein